MKKMFGILALAVVGTACQHQTPPTQSTVGKAVNATTATSPQVLAKPKALALKDTLTPEMLAVLQRYDFSPLLQTVHGTDSLAGSHAQNGSFGPDHYRIEVVFTDVRRDSANPATYYLRGQNRYKSIITPFTGTLTITQLADQPLYSAKRVATAKKEGYELRNDPNLYTIAGNFELREEASRRGAGVFSGRVAVDWQIEENGTLSLAARDNESASQGGEVKFEGSWTDAATHRAYSTVWVNNIFAYSGAQHVLQNFMIGERDPDFNPKYAKLGWNSYWENDEWWAKSPKPSLSL